MRMLSLFSGIGGIDLAAQWAGIETVAFCEIDKFCQKVLAKHWPGVPIFDDVRTLTAESLSAHGIESVDVVAGGFPCQPFSLAGKRTGAADNRHLWPEMLRVIKELRPAWVLGENVPGIIHMELDSVLASLEGADYSCQTFDIPAAGVDAKHRRNRIWIVAHTLRARGRQNTRSASGNEATHEGRAAEHDHIVASNGESYRAADVANANGSGFGERRRPESIQPEDCTAQRVGETVANSPRFLLNRAGSTGQGRRSKPTNSGRWPTEPNVGRVAHGIPRRVDRLRALGNAVVPQVVYPIFEAMAEADAPKHARP